MKKVRIKFSYDFYETTKDLGDVEVYDWSYRPINVLSKEYSLIRIKPKYVSWDEIPRDEGLVTPGELFMYVPEIFLEIYNDLERIL